MFKMVQLAIEVILETERLVIEPISPVHAEDVYKVSKDERIYSFIPQDPPLSVEVLIAQYTTWSARLSPDGTEAWLNWVMYLRGSRICIGTLQATVREDKTGLIAYTLFPDHWKKGYASEGCRAMLNHLLSEYHVSKIYAEVDTRNLASIQLLETLGFQRISFVKDADNFKGNTSDEYRYQLTQ